MLVSWNCLAGSCFTRFQWCVQSASGLNWGNICIYASIKLYKWYMHELVLRYVTELDMDANQCLAFVLPCTSILILVFALSCAFQHYENESTLFIFWGFLSFFFFGKVTSFYIEENNHQLMLMFCHLPDI